MEKQWITVTESLPLEKRSLEGVKVDVLVSPYDVPEGVRGALSEDGKKFVIEFKYISQEDTVERQQDNNAKLRVGRSSGRLYALELDTSKFDPGNVRLRVEVAEALKNVLRHLVKQPVSPLRASNYKVAKQVVENYEDGILQPI
jgi:hypothetical protein